MAVLWLWPEARRWLFALLLLVALVVEWRFARPWRPGAAAAAAAAGSGAQPAGLCHLDSRSDPHALRARKPGWQGHALWHLLGAAAVLATYGYYRSEAAADHGLPVTGRPSLP